MRHASKVNEKTSVVHLLCVQTQVYLGDMGIKTRITEAGLVSTNAPGEPSSFDTDVPLGDGGFGTFLRTIVTVPPVGTSADAANIHAARLAMASVGEVRLKSGTYLWSGQYDMSDNLVESWNPGTVILVQNTNDGTELSAPINANRTSARTVITTLNGASTRGARTIAVTSSTNVVVGEYIQLIDTTANVLACLTYLVVAKAVGTITLDRPVQRSFAALSNVCCVSPPKNIHIFGNGAQITSTAAATTTTIGSHTLPVGTINVTSTAGFASQGGIFVNGQVVFYTGKTGTTFTGCTSGSGIINAGSTVETHAERAVEIAYGWECHVEGLRVTGFSDYAVGYDLGSYRCSFRDIHVDGNSKALAAFTAESSEEIDITECDGTAAGGAGVGVGLLLWGSYGVRVNGGKFHDNTGNGCLITIGGSADTQGCDGVTFNGTKFLRNTLNGVSIADGARNIVFQGGWESSDNSLMGMRLEAVTTPPTDITFHGGTLRRNIGGLYTNGATVRIKAFGLVSEGNTTNSNFNIKTSSEVECFGCSSLDPNGVIPNSTAGLLVNAGTCRWIGGLVSGDSTAGSLGVQIAGSGILDISDTKIVGTGTSGGYAILLSSGTVKLRRVQATGRAGDFGAVFSTGTVAQIDEFDFGATGVPITITGTAVVTMPNQAGLGAITVTGANVTATNAQWGCSTINVTGTVTGSRRDVIMPHIKGHVWTFKVDTTGALGIRVIGSSGTGVNFADGSIGRVMFDGTNYVSV